MSGRSWVEHPGTPKSCSEQSAIHIGELGMSRTMFSLLLAAGLLALAPGAVHAQHPPGGVVFPDSQTYGYRWGHAFSNRDYERFYHYPYVYYPHNFYGNEYFRSRNDLYYRYVPEMQIPVYNRQWFSYYPQYRKFHKGHHFVLDTF
jgi:hypothetical protein